MHSMITIFNVLCLVAFLDSLVLLRTSRGLIRSDRQPWYAWWAMCFICLALLSASFFSRLTSFSTVLMMLSCPMLYSSGDILWTRVGYSPSRSLKFSLVLLAFLVLLPIAVSVLLWKGLSWHIPTLGDVKIPWLDVAITGAVAAVGEEILFRHYLQGRLGLLAQRFVSKDIARVCVMIGSTAILFAVVHIGLIEPLWVKWLQMLILGLCLGIIRLWWGLWYAMGAHLIFNGSVALLLML